MRLYEDLAAWWPLLSPPSEYVEEAADLLPRMLAATDGAPQTLLELGCGGGSLAFHLKHALQLTLTDLSPAMLEVSRAINPTCEHQAGDMRALDLGRTFDLVLIHDAIAYATTPADVQATLATAARHCREGGAVFVLPDCVRETFAPDTQTGGHDGDDGRGLRYLEWTWDPDPGDDTVETVYALLLREPDGRVHTVQDHHRFGLFAHASWLQWLRAAGFDAQTWRDPWGRDVFFGKKL